jgi:hypothetical protein
MAPLTGNVQNKQLYGDQSRLVVSYDWGERKAGKLQKELRDFTLEDLEYSGTAERWSVCTVRRARNAL